MKKTILFFSVFLAFIFCAQAQNSVMLNIHHKLADADFAFNEGAKNNMDHDFNVTRLQYYISEISLIHDGGMETLMENVYVLVDASQPTVVDLGEHEFTNLEAIHFHVGVDPAVNHEDPAGYQPGHPLAPSFPSMHWGWAAGYRFVAIEGFGSSEYNQLYQLHGLGDDNYYKTEIPLGLTATNNKVAINIDGDYTRILEDISVNSGVIVHGDFAEAKQALENFRDFVFSASPMASSTVDFSEVNGFEIYPNPSADGLSTVTLKATGELTYQVLVTDLLGRQVQFFHEVKSNTSTPVQVEQPGLYLVSLIKEGQAVITHKLMVK